MSAAAASPAFAIPDPISTDTARELLFRRFYREVFPGQRIFNIYMTREFDVTRALTHRLDVDAIAFPTDSDIDTWMQFGETENVRYAKFKNGVEFMAALNNRVRAARSVHFGAWIKGQYDSVKRLGAPLRIDVDVRSAAYASVLPPGCELSNPKHPNRLCGNCWYLAAAALVYCHHVVYNGLGINRVCGFFSGSKGVHVEARPETALRDEDRQAVVNGALRFEHFNADRFGGILYRKDAETMQFYYAPKLLEELFVLHVVERLKLLEPTPKEQKTAFGVVCAIIVSKMREFEVPEKTIRTMKQVQEGGGPLLAGRRRWELFKEATHEAASHVQYLRKKGVDRVAECKIFRFAPSNVMAHFLAPRIDTCVSDVSHMMRAPCTVHPATMLIKQPIPFQQYCLFNPDRDAISAASTLSNSDSAACVTRCADYIENVFWQAPIKQLRSADAVLSAIYPMNLPPQESAADK